MENKSRNYFIDFLKFVFSLIIVLYHSWVFSGAWGNGIFNNGYLAVDFYFIVTGYLLMSSVYNSKDTNLEIGVSTFAFIKNKVSKILPNLLFAFVVGYMLVYGNTGFDLPNLLSDKILGELLQLETLGYGLTINTAWWYVSVMLLVLILFFPIAKKYKKNFTYLIAPLIIFFTLTLVKYNSIIINDPLQTVFLFPNGFYKGLIFISLGAICYEFGSYLKTVKLDKLRKSLLTLFEIISYVFLIYNMQTTIAGNLFIALLFTVNIAITFSNQTYTICLFKSKFWEKLGQFGFIMFLNNCAVRIYMVNKNFEYSYHKSLLIFLVFVIGISLVSYLIVEVGSKKLYKQKQSKTNE